MRKSVFSIDCRSDIIGQMMALKNPENQTHKYRRSQKNDTVTDLHEFTM